MIGKLHIHQKQPEPEFHLEFDPEVHSITQVLAPIYRKTAKNESQYLKEPSLPFRDIGKQVQQQYHQLMKTVDDISMFINNRMDTHEKELLMIMKHQLFLMMDQVNTVLNKYKSRMKQSDADDQLEILQDEMEYFKYEALKQFKQKQNLEKQVLLLKSQLRQLNDKESINNIVLHKMKAKLMKQKQRNKQSKSMITLTPNLRKIKGVEFKKCTESASSKPPETLLTTISYKEDVKSSMLENQGKSKGHQSLNTSQREKQTKIRSFCRDGQQGTKSSQLRTAHTFYPSFHTTKKQIKQNRSNIRRENKKTESKR